MNKREHAMAARLGAVRQCVSFPRGCLRLSAVHGFWARLPLYPVWYCQQCSTSTGDPKRKKYFVDWFYRNNPWFGPHQILPVFTCHRNKYRTKVHRKGLAVSFSSDELLPVDVLLHKLLLRNLLSVELLPRASTKIIIIMMMIMIMMMMMMVMMMIIVIIIIVIIIAFKGAIWDLFYDLLTAREQSPSLTLKWRGRNLAQITCNTSIAHHEQHVVLRATWYEGLVSH